MEAERWQVIRAAFEDVLERPAGAQRAYLERAYRKDPLLLAEVEALLAEHERSDPLLDGSPHALLTRSEHDAGSLAGRRLGAYTLLREIGRGGMSQVYLAERSDQTFDRRVAVKLLDGRLRGADVERRFYTERQILANLAHPHIAELLDGGTTEDGIPYLVLPYIDGTPIDNHCDQERLSVAARLILFRDACAAVAYAHRHLIVHCDLKPSNILVTREGVVQLVDFGIARLLAPSAAGGTTGTGLRPLTPSYASPEQLAGRPATTATDVYALGLVLYRLLTGQPAYPAAANAMVAAWQRRDEPRRPSQAVTEADGAAETAARRALRRQLVGDLDHIVMRALRHTPEDRYDSVNRLDDDIQRHLTGRPIMARAGTWRYRGSRFLRRNRLAVAVAATLTMLLLTSVVVASVLAVQHAWQRDQARVERDKAEKVVTLISEVFAAADPEHSRGGEITVREALDAGARQVAVGLEDQPQVRAMLLHTIGSAYHNLGLFEDATPLLEEALRLRRAAPTPQREPISENLATLGSLARDRGDFVAAERFYRESLALSPRAAGARALLIADRLDGLGGVLDRRGVYNEAATYYQQALDIRRAQLGSDHPDLVDSIHNLAFVLRRQGRVAEAEASFRKTRDLAERHLGLEHPTTLTITKNLALFLLQDTDALDEAAALYSELEERELQVLGPEHPKLAFTLCGLAQVEQRRGHLEAAAALYRRALVLRRDRLGADSLAYLVSARKLAGLLIDRADPRRGDLDEAHTLLEAGFAIARQRLEPRSVERAAVLLEAGRLHLIRGELEHAEPVLRESLQIYEAFDLHRTSRLTATSRGLLGACLLQRGALDEAEILLRTSYDVLIECSGTESLQRKLLQHLVTLFQRRGNTVEASRFQQLLKTAETL